MVCTRCGGGPCIRVGDSTIGFCITADVRNSKGEFVDYFSMCTICLGEIEFVFKHTIGRVVGDDHINIWWSPRGEFAPASEKIWLLREEWKTFVEEFYESE